MRWDFGSFASSLARSAVTFGALAVAAAPACERASPTRPATSIPAPLGITPEQAGVLSVTVQDVRTRLLPVLGETGEELGGALDRLDAAVVAQDRTAFVGALSSADAVLLRVRRNESDDAVAPDLDAVRLMLAEARALAVAPVVTDR